MTERAIDQAIDRAIDEIRRAEVPFDDLRQRRVLAAIEARRAQAPRREGIRASRRLLVGLAIGAAAASLALALGLQTLGTSAPAAIELPIAIAETTLASGPTATIPHLDPPRLTLLDGSVAQLSDSARVEVAVQSEDLVRVSQHSGRVRYEVAPDPARSFVVDAIGVEVRVIGTVFSVEVAGEHVEVQVERGQVEVVSGERVARLGASEQLRVEALDPEIVIEPEPMGEEPAGRPSPAAAAPRPAAPARSIEELLAQADAARAVGDAARAAASLSELVSRYPKDPRAYSASFQLGKVQRSRGRHAAAAAAFAACVRRSPQGALAEDARAEAAVAWEQAARHDKALEAAEAYLRQYPAGTHAERMRQLLKRLP